jgi:ribosome-binding protein aMBF1 (putative translation factor)
MRPDTVKSAALIREARLRAGLSQQELAARAGKERTVLARWETRDECAQPRHAD